MSELPYNKACSLEDFADPGLAATVREVYAHEIARLGASFPQGLEHRKHWEVAMSVRALRDFGALRPDAEILGVGAGVEMTVFHCTRHVRRVTATDLYLNPGGWTREATPLMLIAPERISPEPFERDRLTVQHMDGRWLRFPDESFDAVFSSGSIEHFGGLEDIAASAFEMGRVLKPGGLLVLSTELLLAGPPGAEGWPGVRLLAPEVVRRHVIEASGLEPVDVPDFSVSDRTRATERPLQEVASQRENGRELFPHLVLSHEGQVFGSVHLVLRKTERYPMPDNAWAKPSESLREQVRRGEAAAAQRLFGALAGPAGTPEEPAPVPEGSGDRAHIEEIFRRWEAVRSRSSLDEAPPGGPARRAAGFLARTATRIRDLGISWDLLRDLFRALIDRQNALDRRLQEIEAADADVRGAINELRAILLDSNLRDRQEVLRVRQARLEGDVADLREEVAALSPPSPGGRGGDGRGGSGG